MFVNLVAARIHRPAGYESGQCNIGPAEIARRRMAGHGGIIATIVLLGVLMWTDAPVLARLLLFLPVAGAASGYLQAAFRFCANYGWRGVFNFGEAGHHRTTPVTDPDAVRADRRKAALIGLASGAIGLAVALLALLV
jgi:hypothetical protein